MARRFLLSTALSLSLAAPFAMPFVAFAEDTTAEQVANSRNSALAVINADGVYVRSGPGDNYYPTTKLNKDTPVTVVGEKFDWLKITPPKGSFCYVAKAFIEKTADGKAVSNRDDVNVRAGSELNTIKTSVQSKLASGQPVEILGEVDEYYKIKPPADAYVYVKKDYVELKKVIPQVATGGAAQAPAIPPAPQDASNTDRAATADNTATPGIATTNPSIAETPTSPLGQPTTKPAQVAVETEFDQVETKFDEASKLDIDKQPLAELTASYTKLMADPQLPDSMKRMADYRLQTLKVRTATQAQFAAVQKQQTESKQKQLALKAEQEEIAQQIKDKDVKVYTAVGTLRTSSFQQGNQMLYRLTDPQTGRTVCYIRSDDPKYGSLLGQFIGVKGAVTPDATLNLKVVAPTEWATVDPNQLYRGVAAEIVPPSLLPQSAQQASASEK